MMATTIKTKNSTTAATAPTGLAQGELAVNITDKKLYVGDAVGNSIQIAGAGATNAAGGSNTQVQYNSSGALAGSANMTFDGTSLTLGGNPTLSAGTANGVSYLNGSKVLTSGSALVFDGTNLGIGTSSPASPLDIQAANGQSMLRLAVTTGTNAVYSRYGNTGGYLYLGRDNSAGTDFGSAYAAGIWSTGAYPMLFGTNGTEKMRLDSSGNLGLGVTPSAWGGTSKALQFSTGAIESRGTSISLNNNAYFNAGWKYVGAATATLYDQSGGEHTWYYAPSGTAGNAISFTERMRLDASGNLGVGVSSLSYVLQLQKNNTQIWTDCQSSYVEQSLTLSSGTNIDWYQSTKGTGNFIWRQAGTTERMRIDSSGNLLVNTASTFVSASNTIQILGTSAGGIALALKRQTDYGNVQQFVNYGGTTVGTISVAAASTAYNTSSDYRLKENIAPMTGALSVIDQLKPCTYTWKADGSSGQGFIAHELAEVVPDCVTGEKDAVDEEGNPVYQGIDTSFLVATLTAAIQEQQALINDLTNRLTALENK